MPGRRQRMLGEIVGGELSISGIRDYVSDHKIVDLSADRCHLKMKD